MAKPRKRRATNRRWIQGMHMKKGALHADLGVPQGKKIPLAKIRAASKRKGVVGKRARLALTLRRISSRSRRRKKKGR